MIRNYLKVAWRNMLRNKAHTFINVAGLSVGLACSLLILLWVQNELSIDAYHKNGDRLYKVYEREYYDNKIDGNYDTPALMADELKRVFPEVEYATVTASDNAEFAFKAGNKIFRVEGTSASADLFKMFSYPLIQGSPQTALNSISSISISNKMAVMFFGNAAAAMGKTIRYDNKKDFIVTAVFKDIPKNSSLTFDYVINWDEYLLENPGSRRWDNSGPLTYVMLRKGADLVLVDNKLKHFADHYGKSKASYRRENALQRYDQVYLHSNFVNGEIDGGRIEYVNLFSIVAIFVLLIACINFMNLTTAQSVKRAREIGVRKVMGAKRGVLIRQFIGESILLTLISVMLSLLLMSVLLPLFNSITLKEIIIPFDQFSFWLKLIGLVLITGCIAGSYPALFLSSFNPVKVLKGTQKIGTSAVWFRKGLVVFQFTLSAVLIISTIIVSKQVSFIQNRNLGYDRENLLYIPIEGDMGKNFELMKSEALNTTSIASMARMGSFPTFIDNSTTNLSWDGKDPNVTIAFPHSAVGYDFIKTIKAKLVDGRDFSRDYTTDSLNFVINEAARDKMNYKNPVGRSMKFWGRKGQIIGVVKNFHYRSLHDPIQPLILFFRKNLDYGYILVRTKPGKTREAIASLQTIFNKYNPNIPFTYSFSDTEYQRLYTSEQVAGKLSNAFAFLAIFISCLGLLGLAMFTAEQRIKEIGIRKVLGASIGSLFTLLSSEFLLLVIVAMLIATPIAWYAMNRWLQSFAYHTLVQWWVFALSGGLIILIALATVSFQAVKAALINPIKSLRSE